MSHEQSETVQRPDGKRVNVYGRKLPKAGQQLPNSGEYSSVEEAVSAAKKRSKTHDTMRRREDAGRYDGAD